MSITTRVKKTGQLFQATADLGKDKSSYQDANGTIEPDTVYEGHLLDAFAFRGCSSCVEYSRAKWGVFRGYELESVQADLRLVS
jgi:hypothetical protein